MNIGYNGIARMVKQAKLDKAKQSVNYGRTPGSSGSVDTRDYSSPYVPQQNSHQNFSLNSEGILSLPGSSPTTPTGSASMIPPDPSSLVSPFSKKAKAAMAMTYGGAQAPGAAFRMEDDSPLEGNAFVGALEAAKAGGEKSFNVNGKTYPVK